MIIEKLNNYLGQIEFEETCLEFLKSKLKKEYSFDLVRDLFSLPCMKYETKHKLVLILILLEEDQVNDTIIDWLTQLICNLPETMWNQYMEQLSAYIEEKYYQLSRSQLMLLANTVEVMYAKGYNALGLVYLIYQRIPMSNVEFNPDSEDNVRIKLAKIAYSTDNYNISENFATIQSIKYHLKTSGRKYLMGMLNYYKGVCLRAAGGKNGYKDANHYILKARNRGFNMAAIYLSYNANNFETSKTS